MKEVKRILELKNEIDRIKADYKDDKQEAWERHRLIVSAEKAELEPYEKELEDLKEKLIKGEVMDPNAKLVYRKDFDVDITKLPEDYMIKVPDMDRITDELKRSEWTVRIDGVNIMLKTSVKIVKN